MAAEQALNATTNGNLTAAQKRVLLLMEELGPYDQIVIKCDHEKPERILIISTGTQKEVFPKDML